MLNQALWIYCCRLIWSDKIIPREGSDTQCSRVILLLGNLTIKMQCLCIQPCIIISACKPLLSSFKFIPYRCVYSHGKVLLSHYSSCNVNCNVMHYINMLNYQCFMLCYWRTYFHREKQNNESLEHEWLVKK